MSRATNFLEQDAGGGEGDNLPTYENLAQAHGGREEVIWPFFLVFD